MKALAVLVSSLAAVSLLAMFVLAYVGIFTGNETAGWAAYFTGFVTTPVLGGASVFAWMVADGGLE